MKRAALMLLALLAGCYQVTGYAPQPAMSNGPTRTHVVLNVNWVENVDEMKCNQTSILGGCTRCYLIGQDWFCTVDAQQPKDFNDEARLAYLGHEVFHALGANHVPPGSAAH